MLDKSIHLAEQRLVSAHEAFRSYMTAENAADIDSAKRHWGEFLVAVIGAYSKLEQGSKCCGHCTAWFGRVKSERKKDPLLSYLHHARNSDLHGLREVVVHAPQSVAFVPKGKAPLGSVEIGFGFVGQEEEEPLQAKITYGDSSGAEYDVTHLYTQQYGDKRFTLVEVIDDRYGDRWSPPMEHLSKKLDNRAPSSIAQLALDYFGRLIDSAKSLRCDRESRSGPRARK